MTSCAGYDWRRLASGAEFFSGGAQSLRAADAPDPGAVGDRMLGTENTARWGGRSEKSAVPPGRPPATPLD